ncbi:hypothetical protein WAI453_012453 [Rhynchosporium graminicola]
MNNPVVSLKITKSVSSPLSIPDMQRTHLSFAQKKCNAWYAGAGNGYGSDENGFTAGLEAARQIDPDSNLPLNTVVQRRTQIEKGDAMKMDNDVGEET